MRRLLCRMRGWIWYLVLGILTMTVCYLFCIQNGVFGAKVDWISQHSVLPDYFRQQFYETGELFPEFAANIGGGQNIYDFSYYGLYHPLLLPSYLLPFVKMSDYMMAVQLSALTASVLLLYRWLRKRGFSEGICVGVAALFLLSGPMVFHSYHQIMFVSYMPFLLMGLMGVDRHFEKRADPMDSMLTVSIFLMIMSSFYFSIGGMLVLVLYGFHRRLTVCGEEGVKITVPMFLTEGILFALHFITAIMMSGILLVPTAFALMGREGGKEAFRLGELFLPEVSMSRFVYSPYGIGMTTLALTVLIALMFGKKWQERVLAFGCVAILTVPVFAYLLNGGLYVRDKVMIPFLPLLCYILAYYLDRLESSALEFLPYILTIGLVCLSCYQEEIGKYWKLLLLDSMCMLVCFGIYRWVRKARLKGIGVRCHSAVLLIPAILMLSVSGYRYNVEAGKPVNREFYEEVTDPDIGKRIREVLEGEEGFYRMEQLGNDTENAANLNRIWDMRQYSSSIYSSSQNEGYHKFREDIFQLEEPFRNFLMQSVSHNPVYQRFMGVKYVVSKEDVPGYEAVKRGVDQRGGESQGCDSKSEWNVYENDQVSPVAYGTDQVIPEDVYRKLEFPYNQLILLKYAVVKEDIKMRSAKEGEIDQSDFIRLIRRRAEEGVEQIRLHLPEEIDSDTSEKLQVNLPDLSGDETGGEGEKVLFLQFQVENRKPSKDVAVWLEGVRNKLTSKSHYYYNGNTEFTYAVPLKDGQDAVEMVFGAGNYMVSHVRAYLGTLPVNSDREAVFQIDQEKTKGNRIEGTIDMEQSGYFITTIPYDANFEILADGKPADAEEVNTAFLGFKTEAGKHEVKIIYHAPGIKMGKMISVLGFVLLVCRKPFPLFIRRLK